MILLGCFIVVCAYTMKNVFTFQNLFQPSTNVFGKFPRPKFLEINVVEASYADANELYMKYLYGTSKLENSILFFKCF